MRLCFKGFLGHQRPTAVDQSTQTFLSFSTAIDTLNITTFFDKSHAQTQDEEASKVIDTENTTSSFIEKFTMISAEDGSFQNISSESNSAMFSHNSETQFAIDATSDSQNNNHLMSGTSEMELVKSDVVDQMNNIYINDVNMQEIDTEQQLTPKERDLIKIIQLKELRIKELEQIVSLKNAEIVTLKDKIQSVFSFSRTGAMGRKMGHNIQRQRAQGISAEPQSESSMTDLLNVTFPKYEKEETWVQKASFFDKSVCNWNQRSACLPWRCFVLQLYQKHWLSNGL